MSRLMSRETARSARGLIFGAVTALVFGAGGAFALITGAGMLGLGFIGGAGIWAAGAAGAAGGIGALFALVHAATGGADKYDEDKSFKGGIAGALTAACGAALLVQTPAPAPQAPSGTVAHVFNLRCAAGGKPAVVQMGAHRWRASCRR